MNGNGNGRRVRIKAQSVDTPDTVSYCYCLTTDGGLLLAERHEYKEDSHGVLWTTVWEDVPPNTVVLRIAIFSEGGGYWEPLELPSEQTDAQVVATEKLLRIHGLSLTAAVGLKRSAKRRD